SDGAELTPSVTQNNLTQTIDVNAGLYIGSRGGVQNLFNGDINDVRIYKIALSPANVTNLYNGLDIASGSIVSEWQFDNAPAGALTYPYSTPDAHSTNNANIQSGATFARGVYVDQNKNAVVENPKVDVAAQHRFVSSNSTGSLTVNATASAAKTYLWT